MTVPIIEPDLTLDVETWWAQHPYHLWVATSGFREQEIGFIQSPEPIVNVASFGATPTAGIQEAIDSLPISGGTLYFPPGIYNITAPLTIFYNRYFHSGAVVVQRRSNLHFIGDDRGEVIITAPHRMLAFSSQEFADICRDPFIAPPGNVRPGCGQQPGLETNPNRNFYFRNLTFDGQGQAITFIRFEGCRDILFSHCIFRNGLFNQAGQSHPGFVECISGNNNVWIKDCTFIGDGRSALYWDGGRGNGVVNCSFLGRWSIGPMVLLTNDDIQRRSTNMFACVNNYFDGASSQQLITIAGGQMLFEGNTSSRASTSNNYIVQDGKVSFFEHTYDNSNLVVKNNTMQGRAFLGAVEIVSSGPRDKPQGVAAASAWRQYRIGQFKIVDNVFRSSRVVDETIRDGGGIDGPNVVQRNQIIT